MLKEILWKSFENTGNIDAYMLIKEIEGKTKAPGEEAITREEVAISK